MSFLRGIHMIFESFTDSIPLADEGPRVLSASLVPELHVNMVVPDFECVHSGSQTQIVTLVWQDPS